MWISQDPFNRSSKSYNALRGIYKNDQPTICSDNDAGAGVGTGAGFSVERKLINDLVLEHDTDGSGRLAGYEAVEVRRDVFNWSSGLNVGGDEGRKGEAHREDGWVSEDR